VASGPHLALRSVARRTGPARLRAAGARRAGAWRRHRDPRHGDGAASGRRLRGDRGVRDPRRVREGDDGRAIGPRGAARADGPVARRVRGPARPMGRRGGRTHPLRVLPALLAVLHRAAAAQRLRIGHPVRRARSHPRRRERRRTRGRALRARHGRRRVPGVAGDLRSARPARAWRAAPRRRDRRRRRRGHTPRALPLVEPQARIRHRSGGFVGARRRVAGPRRRRRPVQQPARSFPRDAPGSAPRGCDLRARRLDRDGRPVRGHPRWRGGPRTRRRDPGAGPPRGSRGRRRRAAPPRSSRRRRLASRPRRRTRRRPSRRVRGRGPGAGWKSSSSGSARDRG